MPPPKQRKKPFSAKQKKEQLQVKREKKRSQQTDEFGHRIKKSQSSELALEVSEGSQSCSDCENDNDGVKKLNVQPKSKNDAKYNPNRYRLHFVKDTPAEIEKRKRCVQQPYQSLSEDALEVDIDDVYQPGSVLDIPKRPPWNYRTSKSVLESREESYFKQYLEDIFKTHQDNELSYFELNLETWRQLWRVLEISDVILLITDIRHPALHFSPAFYKYVTSELGKPLILVLNKVDLAPPSLVVAWKHYFAQKFPEIRVICFTSFPREKQSEALTDPGKILHKRRKRRVFAAAGPRQLLEACEEIVQGQVDLSSWREKIEGEIAGMETDHQVELRLEELTEPQSEHIKFKDGLLTIGCCGYPNVGKSSLMNGLMGRKVVSVSKTPGHTKHFQTIYLTPSVKLCDCPGLVFPSLVPKPMQILAGIYPIAQVREPYSAVDFLAQRLNLVELLKIRHPEASTHTETGNKSWSAMDICDAWAQKRGFLTAKAARPDFYRAANQILRLAVDGRLCLCTRPPGFTRQKADWQIHSDTHKMCQLLEIPKLSPSTTPEYLSPSDLDTDDATSQEDAQENRDEDEDTGSDQSENSVSVGNNPFALLGDE